jgi:hypothetical protein
MTQGIENTNKISKLMNLLKFRKAGNLTKLELHFTKFHSLKFPG